MTLKNGTGQACAACKFQRRRCTSECLLAPFFPADQPKMFQNVHKLFGVKHIQNLLQELNPDQKTIAIKSLKYHAAMRDKYPVHGCLVEIHNLYYQINMAEIELQSVLQQLAYYQQQQQQQEIASPTNDYLSLGMTNGSLVRQENPLQCRLPVATSDSNNGNLNGDFSGNYQQTCSYNDSANILVMQSEMDTSQAAQSFHQETNQDYNEFLPFFETIDDRRSHIRSKEVYESRFESPQKDSRRVVEQIADSELKTAAACFSLTSVN